MENSENTRDDSFPFSRKTILILLLIACCKIYDEYVRCVETFPEKFAKGSNEKSVLANSLSRHDVATAAE